MFPDGKYIRGTVTTVLDTSVDIPFVDMQGQPVVFGVHDRIILHVVTLSAGASTSRFILYSDTTGTGQPATGRVLLDLPVSNSRTVQLHTPLVCGGANLRVSAGISGGLVSVAGWVVNAVPTYSAPSGTPTPTPTAAYVDVVLSDNPAGYWRLGESSGTNAADGSGNSHPGTYSGTYVQGAAGAIAGDANTSVTFTDGQVAVGSTFTYANADFTLEAWIFFGSLAVDGRAIFSKGDFAGLPGTQYEIIMDASNLTFSVFNAAGAAAVQTPTPSMNQWHHVVGTRSGTTSRLYLDGTEVGTPGTLAGPLSGVATNTSIGRSGTGNLGPFNGRIDEAAIYSAAISASRILAHYNRGITAPF